MSDRADDAGAGGVLEGGGELFAGGFDNPRGLSFGPDGWLYVAEGGCGGSSFRTDPAEFEQVPPPIGPYTGGQPSGRVRRISPDGETIETVAEGLPSSQTSPGGGSMVSGAADIAFLDGELYALIAGGGSSHGLAGTANGVVRIEAGGTVSLVADLGSFWRTHPVAETDPADHEPDGTPFSMIASGGRLYVVEAHGGAIDEVTSDGAVARFVDLSATEGHVVPTALASANGVFYLACLGRFPVRLGGASIFVVRRSGGVDVLAERVTAATGIAGGAEALFVVESTTAEGSGPVPGTGRLVRVEPASGKSSVIATGLSFPTAAVLGPDGMLYLSNRSFGSPPGSGEILRFDVGEPSVGYGCSGSE